MKEDELETRVPLQFEFLLGLHYIVRSLKGCVGGRGMAQWIKAIVNKPEDLSSIPGSHMMKREPTPESCPLISVACPSIIFKGGCHHVSSFPCKDPQSH